MLLGEYSVRTGKNTSAHKSTYTIDTRLATGEVIQLQQAAIRTRSHFSGAGHRPACQAGGFKATEARSKSVSLQCSFPGMNFQQRPWQGQCWYGEPKKIRLRLFRLGVSNRIPIPRLLSLSTLISNIINFLLQSRELLHDRIHIAVNSLSPQCWLLFPLLQSWQGSLVRLWTAVPVFWILR